MFNAGMHVTHLLIGMLLFPAIYILVSGTKIDNHYIASLAIYAPTAIAYALYVRKRHQPSKELVDLVYYTVGIIGVVIFTWTSYERIKNLDLPRADLAQAIIENQSELDEAQHFSNLFFNDRDTLVGLANDYLSGMSATPIRSACVHEYGLYDGSGGIHYLDHYGTLIRKSMELNVESPVGISQKCHEAFGGAPVTTNMFNFWKANRPAEFRAEDLPFNSVESISQIESYLYVFLAFKATENSMEVSEFVEYLVDDDGKVLPPYSILQMADVSREYHSLPIDLSWFDTLVGDNFSSISDRFELALWPVIAIFLLSLKITIISKPAARKKQ